MKAVSTFIRQQLKIKGKTQHNGRGMYEMTANDPIDRPELIKLLRTKIDEWIQKGYVTSYESTKDEIMIQFDQDQFKSSYSKFWMGTDMRDYDLGYVLFTLSTPEQMARECPALAEALLGVK